MVRIGMFLGDRYEILEKIGSGGMAQVFKGKDHKLNRFVAVKVLKDEFVEDKNFVRKFKEEAQAAAALAHPNIVNVYDVGDEQNINYIVMELVEGITLKTYIEKKGRLTVKEATSIAIQVASGLEIAHNNQIVHRDIKPQNIIISREGKVKVTDFGIAKSVSSNTNTADAMGSVHYTSPEQARGGYSDAKSDIYSLGIVMYEMVTGRVPFDGETTVVVAVKHLQEDIVSPRVYASDIPISLEHIILKCTEKSPDRRYPNVTELIADLKQSLLTPDVNFVKEIVPDGAKTVAITRDEISKIKKETGRLPVDEDDAESRYAYLDRMNDDDEYDDDEYDDEYDDDDEYDEYDDDEYDDEYDDEEESDDEEDDDDEGGVLDPKLEKIMMIGGIAAAVIILIIVIVIVVRLVGFGGGSNNSSSDNEPEIEDVIEENPVVPDLLGMSYSEAQEALNELGLGIKVSETRSSDEYEAGQIIEQSVDEGTEVEPNTTIYVVICGDGSSVEVPDLEDYTRESAVSALENLGLSADVTEEYNDDVASGRVISTSPKAGESVERGGVVKIVISKGSEEDAQVQVPDLRNRSEATAKQLLSQAELSSGTVTTEASDTVASGNVISQSPSAGTTVDKGTSVSYVVSTGPEQVHVGDYRGYTRDQIIAKLETEKGLRIAWADSQYDNSGEYAEGTVLSHDHRDTNVAKGTTITVVMSLGKEKIRVPDVSSSTYTLEEAKKQMPAGISVTVDDSRTTTDPNLNNIVYNQSKTGDVDKNTQVILYVYKYVEPTPDPTPPTEGTGGTDNSGNGGTGDTTTSPSGGTGGGTTPTGGNAAT